MIIISYDISNDKMRGRFQRMLSKNGAVRLQYSVYEVENSARVIDNIRIKIESYSKHFKMDDSIIIIEVPRLNIIKYGNAIHRDKPVVFL